MRGDTHILGGITAAVAAAPLLMDNPTAPANIAATGFLVVASVIGSLTPDIDHPGSKFGRRVKIASGALSAIFGHRKFCHSIWFLGVLLFALFIAGVPSTFAIGFGIGFISHILLDMFTVSGVQFLAPVSSMNFRIMQLRTGTWHEGLVAFGLIFVIGVTFVNMNGLSIDYILGLLPF